MLKSFQIFSQSASVYSVTVLATALIQMKDHSNISPAEWTSVPTLMHRLHARLAETLMSTGDQSYTSLRGSLRLIRLRSSRRMPLLREFQTLVQHPVAVSDRSFVPHPRLRRRRHQSLLEDGHSTLQCGRPCCDLWHPRTASMYRPTRRCHSD